MPKQIFFPVFLASAIFCLTFSACDDSSTLIGSGLLPAEDYLVIHSDTISGIKAKNIAKLPLRTDDQQSFVVGKTFNSYFGRTTASFITGFIPDDYDTSYISGRTLVAANLYLYCNQIFAQSGEEVQFNVYEARVNPQAGKNGIKRSEVYYSDNKILDYYQELNHIYSRKFSTSIDSLPKDSRQRAYIKIPIGLDYIADIESIKGALYRDKTLWDTVYTKDDEFYLTKRFRDFDSVFATKAGGLYIETQNTDDFDALYHLSVRAHFDERYIYHGTSARIELIYENDTNKNLITTRYYLLDPNPSLSRYHFTNFVKYESNHTGYPVRKYLNTGNESDSILFLQGMGGATIQLELPDLGDKPYIKGNAIINNVTLYIEADTNHTVSKNYGLTNRVYAGKNISSFPRAWYYLKRLSDAGGAADKNTGLYKMALPGIFYDTNYYSGNQPKIFLYPATTETELAGYTDIGYNRYGMDYGVFKGSSVKIIVTYTQP